MTEDIKRRIGRFNIHWDAIHNNPHDVMQILSRVLVVRAEGVYWSHEIEYTALSLEFDEVKEGLKVPKYDVLIMKCKEAPGQIGVEFEKKDETL